jgi:hypothetical protein
MHHVPISDRTLLDLAFEQTLLLRRLNTLQMTYRSFNSEQNGIRSLTDSGKNDTKFDIDSTAAPATRHAMLLSLCMKGVTCNCETKDHRGQ